MKQLYLLTALLVMAQVAGAQKKPFFQNVEVGSFFYFDPPGFGNAKWPQLFANGVGPLSPNFNQMEAFIPKDMPVISGNYSGTGLLFTTQKNTGWLKKSSSRLIYFNPGIGVHTQELESLYYSYFPFRGQPPYDTTKSYRYEGEYFQLKQTFADIYGSLTLEANPENNWKASLYLGFAVQASIPISSKIEERYSTREEVWSTAQQQWVNLPSIVTKRSVPAQKSLFFSYTIPAGIKWKLANHLALKTGGSYIRSYRPVKFSGNPRFTQGVVFSASFNYTFR